MNRWEQKGVAGGWLSERNEQSQPPARARQAVAPLGHPKTVL